MNFALSPQSKIEIPAGSLSAPNFDRYSSHPLSRSDVTLGIGTDNSGNRHLELRVAGHEPQIIAQYSIAWSRENRMHLPICHMKQPHAPGYDLDQIIDAMDAYREIEADNAMARCERFDRSSSGHPVISLQNSALTGSDSSIEFVYQTRAGDCVLANFLNTWAVEHTGLVPCTIEDARDMAISIRTARGESPSDIRSSNSALSFMDTVQLFSIIHDQAPRQSDIKTLDGRSDQLWNNVASLLHDLSTSEAKSIVCGLGGHCTSIVKTSRHTFLWYDPMDPNGSLQERSFEQMLDLVLAKCENRSADQNFFFKIRK